MVTVILVSVYFWQILAYTSKTSSQNKDQKPNVGKPLKSDRVSLQTDHEYKYFTKLGM
ncbi:MULTISPECIES: hypothetical protein [Pseudanabaena]|uniref:hypothetical protein n=1 Tax=Pseudanabaena TaxID=1152 RepID=UPI00247A6C8C|nr:MULTISPECIES: hypothetical protein [Pseudanabaena]WGS70417.1 hypothetical protein OA858_11805 [Pseudanabaena galeata CCNP1313]